MCYNFKDIDTKHFSEEHAIKTLKSIRGIHGVNDYNAHFSMMQLVNSNEELCRFATDGDIFVACNFMYEILKDLADDKIIIEIARRLFLAQGAMNIRLSLQSRSL